MNESLWALPADELLSRTASADPTPGGGSVAAIAGALGIGLMQMALAVTADPALDEQARRFAELRDAVVPAADGDVADFTELMAAYRLPRGDDAERETRAAAIEHASIAATERPLGLVGTLADAVALSREVEHLVKPGVASDVLAGRDLALGAARAGIRTADINIAQLDRLGAAATTALRARRNTLIAQLEDAS
ncbi:cyclodeaminase/cyclohydrolase family protein [Gryllotalpicola reticulitermitis]|uniref:Cyclodeaminase/cyclohydrolase family protein n=1 Tax=Gryllotalpicola reticulitermitis TaxID=1184153 RepID=A0ABV8Q4T7_9MICO